MKRNVFLLVVTLLSLWSCGGDDDHGPAPGAAQLIFPGKNSECISGISISPTESSITFSWEASENTDSYRLRITNLNSGDFDEYSTNVTSLAVTLLKGEPYSWSVTSLAGGTSQTTQSEVWNFYNAGEGITSYAPFPAAVVYPQMGTVALASGGNITLYWDGADVDDDISGYDVYFDTVNPPVTIVGTSIGAESFQVSGVAAATVYYWRVITRDGEGNTSASDIFQFRTAD